MKRDIEFRRRRWRFAFEKKFRKDGPAVRPELGPCWPWTASKLNACGYGQFRLNAEKMAASRAAWILYVGPIPDGLHVLHKCDNPPCVRLERLFLGTPRDNIQDAISKGRWHHQRAARARMGDFGGVDIQRGGAS